MQAQLAWWVCNHHGGLCPGASTQERSLQFHLYVLWHLWSHSAEWCVATAHKQELKASAVLSPLQSSPDLPPATSFSALLHTLCVAAILASPSLPRYNSMLWPGAFAYAEPSALLACLFSPTCSLSGHHLKHPNRISSVKPWVELTSPSLMLPGHFVLPSEGWWVIACVWAQPSWWPLDSESPRSPWPHGSMQSVQCSSSVWSNKLFPVTSAHILTPTLRTLCFAFSGEGCASWKWNFLSQSAQLMTLGNVHGPFLGLTLSFLLLADQSKLPGT